MANLTKDPLYKKNILLKASIEANSKLAGIESNVEFAKRIGICPSALYAKFRNPNIFTLRDFRRMKEIKGFDFEDVMKYI